MLPTSLEATFFIVPLILCHFLRSWPSCFCILKEQSYKKLMSINKAGVVGNETLLSKVCTTPLNLSGASKLFHLEIDRLLHLKQIWRFECLADWLLGQITLSSFQPIFTNKVSKSKSLLFLSNEVQFVSKPSYAFSNVFTFFEDNLYAFKILR